MRESGGSRRREQERARLINTGRQPNAGVNLITAFCRVLWQLTTRWGTILSSKVNMHHAINFRAV